MDSTFQKLAPHVTSSNTNQISVCFLLVQLIERGNYPPCWMGWVWIECNLKWVDLIEWWSAGFLELTRSPLDSIVGLVEAIIAPLRLCIDDFKFIWDQPLSLCDSQVIWTSSQPKAKPSKSHFIPHPPITCLTRSVFPKHWSLPHR